MDIEKYKTVVYDLQLRAFDRKPDSKVVMFWASALSSGEKSEIDLVTFVIKSVEYHTRVMAKFKSMWSEIVGTDFEQHVAIFDQFFAKIAAEFKIVSEEDIVLYIKTTEPFVFKVSSLITTLFTSKTGRSPVQADIESFLTKFQSINDYTISMLEADIDAFERGVSCITVLPLSPVPVPLALERETVDLVFPEKSLEQRVALAERMALLKRDDRALLDVLCTPEPKPVSIVIDHAFVTSFETVFGRPIYIQEYAKYFAIRGDIDLARVRQTHIDRYHEIHNMLAKFLAKKLTEHDYVRDYLNRMDDPEFVRALNDDIVYDPIYISLMSTNISKRYTQMYDEQLETSEVAYIFERVQKAHLELEDARLDDHLIAFKSETDEIIKRVYKLYTDIYERMPERSELLEKFNNYRAASRSGVSFETIDAKIEVELMTCLEFHDIIKKRIRAVKKDIPVSDMFKVLSQIIANLGNIRISELDAHIKEYINL